MSCEDHEPSGNPAYRTRFDPNRESAATATVYAISRLEGVEPDELDHYLNDVVGPDALDSVISRGNGVVVDFVFEGYDVFVDSEGEIRVYDAEA